MPVYTYRCKNCGIQFDEQQKFSDPPLTRCPECSKKTLTKVYQPVGIVFKGSGFYATDHRSPSGASRSSAGKAGEGGEKGEKSEKSAPASSGESSGTSAASKPAESKD